MIIEKIKKFRLSLFILLLPLICFITRKISKPLYPYPITKLNSNSFFGNSELNITNNTLNKEVLNIKYINDTRLFIQTKYNKINLFFTFSKYIYYEDFNISININLDINESALINNNNSLSYEENFSNNSNIISINENRKKSLLNFFFKNRKNDKNFTLNKIYFTYNKNNETFECVLTFENFDLIINLEQEKLTFKFYYLIECLINILIYLFIFGTNFYENNFQNINMIFYHVISAKFNYLITCRLLDLYQVGIPIINLIKLYPHFLMYGEILLSFSDILTLVLLFFFICMFIIFTFLYDDVLTNYYYCFNNKIVNNQIVKKEKIIELNKTKIIFVLLNVFYSFLSSESIYIQSLPLIILIIFTILKQLYKREVMHEKDKNFCIDFYMASITIDSYVLLIYNLGEFYKRKPTFAIYPFIIIFILYKILIYVIQYEYKFKFVMKKDFEIIKKLDKDCCSICLRNFGKDPDKNKNKNHFEKYFCKITEEENIHETNCKHYYHEKCLFNWRKYRNICPICKAPLTIPDYYYFYDETPCIYKPNWL